jgi:hypothetical protein
MYFPDGRILKNQVDLLGSADPYVCVSAVAESEAEKVLHDVKAKEVRVC